ncbi:hypothetical protein EIP91_006175 [Steccherinum ochraceum]|uniref:Uncharacterized protein n=1 Tax=Steccherinum ochraceum TaxID=92696 RepID=A0A4R0RGX2_9APHY|nr:hypothetical protein EIP91_006175 [Steccherinum ochraceum]
MANHTVHVMAPVPIPSSPTRIFLLQAAADVCTSTCIVQAWFTNGSILFGRLQATFSWAPPYHRQISRLRSQWQDIGEGYQKTIWDSRELVGEVQAVAFDVVSVFLARLGDPTISLDMKIQELKQYFEPMGEQTLKFERIRSAFKVLRDRVCDIHCRLNLLFSQLRFIPMNTLQRLLNLFERIQVALTVHHGETLEGKGVQYVLGALVSGSQGIQQGSPSDLRDQCPLPPYLTRGDDQPLPEAIERGINAATTQVVTLCRLSLATRVDLRRLAGHMHDQGHPLEDRLSDLCNELQGLSVLYLHVVDAAREYQVQVVPQTISGVDEVDNSPNCDSPKLVQKWTAWLVQVFKSATEKMRDIIHH